MRYVDSNSIGCLLSRIAACPIHDRSKRDPPHLVEGGLGLLYPEPFKPVGKVVAMFTDTEDAEIWKNIPGFIGYQASSDGRVRSVDRYVGHNFGGTKRLPGKVLKEFTVRGGYKAVSLSIAGNVKKMRVSRLVLAAFNGWQDGFVAACHNDNSPSNNCLKNLRWDTYAGNELDKVPAGTSNIGERNTFAILCESQVIEIRKRLKAGCKGVDLAQTFGVSPSTIVAIKKRRSWRHIA